MSNAGRMATHLHTSHREDDWRRADEWRRLHDRSDVEPVPVLQPKPRFGIARILRLIPHKA
jgi:hypothetical protein